MTAATAMPRPDSDTGRAIAFIRQRGSARSSEIGEHIGKSAAWVVAALAPCVFKGLLVTCKVVSPSGSGQMVNEYRLSVSGRPVDARSWKAVQHEGLQRKLKEAARPPSGLALEEAAGRAAGASPGAEGAIGATPSPKYAALPRSESPARPADQAFAGADALVIDRIAMWSDGTMEFVCDGGRRVVLQKPSTRKLVSYLRAIDAPAVEAA